VGRQRVNRQLDAGAGAVALAALLAGRLPELTGKRVVVPLTGGNIDTTVLGRCIDRGLAVDGRLARFEVGENRCQTVQRHVHYRSLCPIDRAA
jgi:threonine dehydratase